MSATFLLVCFVFLKENTFETTKNIFYFTSKALFVLEIIKFKHFRYSNIMTSSNAQAWNTKHILLNNLGRKCSLVMKFGQFMQLQNDFFIKKFYEKYGLENSPRPFLISKKSSLEKILWESRCWFGQILIDLILRI